MASISEVNQIYSDLQAPNYTVIPKVGCNSLAYKYHLDTEISYGLAQKGYH